MVRGGKCPCIVRTGCFRIVSKPFVECSLSERAELKRRWASPSVIIELFGDNCDDGKSCGEIGIVTNDVVDAAIRTNQ